MKTIEDASMPIGTQRFYTESTLKIVDHDVHGKPIRNSAGEPMFVSVAECHPVRVVGVRSNAN